MQFKDFAPDLNLSGLLKNIECIKLPQSMACFKLKKIMSIKVYHICKTVKDW